MSRTNIHHRFTEPREKGEIKSSVPSERIYQTEFGLYTSGCYSDILWVLL